ncbi:hypothetical protein ACP4OV_028898 [Aristida adscensionis]
MATNASQPPAPTMPAVAGRRGNGGAAPKPRRGQIKEKIFKGIVAKVGAVAAVIVRTGNNGGGGGDLPAVSGYVGKK